MCEQLLRQLKERSNHMAASAADDRVAGLAVDNNLTERSIRPLAIARKISGGSRSSASSKIRMALQSLFSTWEGQGQDPIDACLILLGANM